MEHKTDGGSLSREWGAEDELDEHEDMRDEGKKRKRLMTVSCEMCKQRKVKCDRDQPTCGWCLRNNQLCEYKERRKPGLRAGYGRELESRLDRLETIIQAQQDAIAQLKTAVLPQAQNLVPREPIAKPSASTPLTASAAVSKPHDMAVVTPTTKVHTPLSPGAPSVGDFKPGLDPLDPSYPHTQKANTISQSMGPALPAEQPSFFSPMEHPFSTRALGVSDATIPRAVDSDYELPPYGLLYNLVDLYFKHVNTWCPILHRKATLDALFGPSGLEEADRVILHAIVATTLRFSDDRRLTVDKRERYHATSRQKVLLYGIDTSSVKSLQALLIVALDTCGSLNGPPGWNLLALICRSAVQLGLSMEASSPAIAPKNLSIYTLRATFLAEPANFIEDESRRRLFWMIYVLDRYSTLATAFDFALDEKEIDRRLPCRDEFFSRNQPVETSWFRRYREQAERKTPDKPENLGSFSFYIEAVGILSKIHLFLKEPVDITVQEDVEKWQAEYRSLNRMLNNWKNSLPKEYGSLSRFAEASAKHKAMNCGWIMLHGVYHTTVIRLHTSAAYPARCSHIFEPSYNASLCCIGAVESIAELCNYVKDSGMLNKLGPLFAFTVWVAARVLLVHSSTTDQQIRPEIEVLISTLQEIGVHWNVATRYVTLIQRVLDEFAESERLAATAAHGERITPSSIKILSDMRRCAYDLDWLISRQPRLQLTAVAGAGGGQDEEAATTTTLSRGLAPPEFEYLDLFDFFNMPRLPMGFDGVNGHAVPTFGDLDGNARGVMNTSGVALEPSRDWLTHIDS